MKKIVSMVLTVALAAPVVVSAADTKPEIEKNLCLVNSENCSSQIQSYTIKDKILMLQKELHKGTSVYKANELQHLEAKLADNQLLFTALTTK